AQTAPETAPPPVMREFRGLWVATVANIDWPSKAGESTWDQQRELLAILDTAAALHFNAIVLQIRPGADAFYASPYEPWSEFLTGRQGRAPEPAWDPLAFAVTEAHKRGMELHAWFNPYRAAYTKDTAEARTHITQTHPELVHAYGHFLWMDPGDPAVRRRAVRAIVDVVKRYDVDGVHIDDYFYPYPENDADGHRIDFPDSATYARYLKRGGTLAKDDWRRQNVHDLVEALFNGVRAAKPWVMVGISPFGIWRPGNPPQIKGFDAYQEIYADSKLWLQKGWLDYLAPQLYWPIQPPEQSFPVLYDWWRSENTKHRHIWPGVATYRVAEQSARHIRAQEIVDEIDSVRARGGDMGLVHFNATALRKNADSLDAKLFTRYAAPALIPASPWLGATPPAQPTITLGHDRDTGEPFVTLAPGRGVKTWWWTVRSDSAGVWTTEVLPGSLRRHRLPSSDVTQVIVTGVSRTGIESRAAMARWSTRAKR
ncbi:MAG TPA: family 10 glycosylhydrolase, partial [Gemmatimonadaceae bacterium]|nr:family 10 glycosylhydrolase [Gemmatimonadaceae bacterium]